MKDSEYNFLKKLVKRFQTMMSSGDVAYFDQDELIDIIDFYLYEFEIDHAEQAIDYALSFYPDQPLFRLQKVKKLIMEFEFEAAKKELQEMENQYAPTVEFFIEKIFLTEIVTPDADISGFLEKAYSLDPNNPDLHFFYAGEAIKNGNLSKALDHSLILLKESKYGQPQQSP